MESYVALVRGINVGGRNPLPMAALSRMLEALGAQHVRTYIQSGNAAFRAPARAAARMAAGLTERIAAACGFTPFLQVLTRPALARALADNHYPQAVQPGNTLHLGFMARAPERPRLDRMTELQAPTEAFALSGAVFYLHAPDGIGRSRLAASAERLLGEDMTLRNWRTLSALLALAPP